MSMTVEIEWQKEQATRRQPAEEVNPVRYRLMRYRLHCEPRIYRVAARIHDLRDAGHEIEGMVCQEHFDPTSNHARYKLVTQKQEALF